MHALRRVASTYLRDSDWHIVFYMYMGVFPSSRSGATALIADAARIAARAGCRRIIVKTPAEAFQIPDIKDNVMALKLAHEATKGLKVEAGIDGEAREHAESCYAEAMAILDAVLFESEDIGRCIEHAFKHGLLDVPYCIHQDNRGITRSYIDPHGALRWAKRGYIPGIIEAPNGRSRSISASDLLCMLQYKSHLYGNAV